MAAWLRPLVELVKRNWHPNITVDQVVALNIREQVQHVRKALHGRDVQVHAWVYDLGEGLIRQLPEPRN